MSRAKIDEMARSLCLLKKDTCEDCTMNEHCLMRNCAECFYNAGYRKDSDIIDEFVERLRQKAHTMSCYDAHYKGDFDAVDIDDVHQIAKEIENED